MGCLVETREIIWKPFSTVLFAWKTLSCRVSMELCKSNCIYNSKSTSTGSGVAVSGFGVVLVVAAWGSGFGVVMVIARVRGSVIVLVVVVVGTVVVRRWDSGYNSGGDGGCDASRAVAPIVEVAMIIVAVV